MLKRKDSRSVSPALFAALVLVAGACGGAVMAGKSDSGPDVAASFPVLYDAAGGRVGLGADSAMSSPPIGSSGGARSSSSSSSSGGSGSPVGLCPGACRLDSDCASCPWSVDKGANCCIMAACVAMAACPTIRDSDAGAPSDAGACSPVLASDYDQSCVADSDCVQVGEAPQCPPTACDGCRTKAVNKVDATRYQTALMQAFAAVPPGGPHACSCPCDGIAICRGGKCLAGGCVPSVADALPACADAGGRCSYAANTTCNTAGPPSSCANADEVCCL